MNYEDIAKGFGQELGKEFEIVFPLTGEKQTLKFEKDGVYAYNSTRRGWYRSVVALDYLLSDEAKVMAWKPKVGEHYKYVQNVNTHYMCMGYWCGNVDDELRYMVGNVFKPGHEISSQEIKKIAEKIDKLKEIC